MKKGISPLIATILIIGFTVVLAALVMMWAQPLFEEKQCGYQVFIVTYTNTSLNYNVVANNRGIECNTKFTLKKEWVENSSEIRIYTMEDNNFFITNVEIYK